LRRGGTLQAAHSYFGCGPTLETARCVESDKDAGVRDIGRFELMIMLVVAMTAFAGAPYHYAALPGAILLTISTLYEYAHLQPRFARAGATRLMAGGVLLAAGTSLAFASLCFAIGRFFAWLITA
jgi:hypothetical protein